MFQDQSDHDEIALVGRSDMGESTLMRESTDHGKFTASKKPGVTRKPNHFSWSAEEFMLTDFPGFGFTSGVDRDTREAVKTNVVQYIEKHADDILAAVLIVDGKNVIDVIDRRTTEDSIPHDVEMFSLLDEPDIPTVVVVNKVDKADDRDERLNGFYDRLGLFPPWKRWRNIITPITAKHGDIFRPEDALRSHLHKQGRDDLPRLL